jgi:hypothetical protein
MTTEESNKIENPIMRLMAILYIAMGIVQIGYFAVESATAPPHLLLLGLVSLITAYMIFVVKKWALPLVVGLFFVGLTFGATTLANSFALQAFADGILINIALIVYVIVLLIATIYIVTKRELFN